MIDWEKISLKELAGYVSEELRKLNQAANFLMLLITLD